MSATQEVTVRVLAVLEAGRYEEVVEVLEEDGLRVQSVESVTEALSALSERPFDAVICRLSSDDGDDDGLSLLREIRTFDEGIPVVVLTEDARVGEAFAAGATDCVPLVADGDRYDRLPARLRSVVAWRDEPGERSRAAIDEELKQRAIDEAPVGITIADPDLPDNPMVYVNESYMEMTGYDRSEALGRNCRFLQGTGSDPDTVAAMREAIAAEEPVSVELVNYRKDGSSFWNRVDIAPIHDEAGEVTHFVGFQTDITARKRAEAAARRYATAASRESERLERLIDRTEGLLQDVTSVLVGAETREEIETGVCERLVETDPYAAAWIGDSTIASGVIVPRVRAGAKADAFSSLSIDADEPEAADPTARAASTRRVQIARAGTADALHPGSGDLGESFRAMAAIPIAHRETLYGVLNVYAEDADALDETEEAVLSLVGRAVGAAVSAFESRRVLLGSGIVELEIGISDPSVALLALAAGADCRVTYEGSVSRNDGSVILFVSVAPDGERIGSVAVDLADVDRADRITTHDGVGLYELHCPSGTLISRIANAGGRIRRLEADDDSLETVVEVADRPTARSLFASLEEAYQGVELLGSHERERPPSTRAGFLDSLTDRLTERQETALRTAYLAGFFEWPHAVSGDELAETMGVSRSTFHQHLRAAQRKLLGGIYDTEQDPT
jgi:PAS domain S-box-containing protein